MLVPLRNLNSRKGTLSSASHLVLLLVYVGIMHRRQFAQEAFWNSDLSSGVHSGSSHQGCWGLMGTLPPPFPGTLPMAAYNASSSHAWAFSSRS